jgi:hypothetical protein
MSELKRDFTKYVRDGGKALYKRGTECRVCGTRVSLQFHHTKSLAQLVNTWVKKKGLRIETEDDAFKWRDIFIQERQKEMYDDTLTLCKEHHEGLHKVYGKSPGLGTSEKQRRWVEKQRIKYGLD